MILADDDQEEDDLLCRLQSFTKSDTAYVTNLADFGRHAVNDSGYSSQQTGHETLPDNPKVHSLLSKSMFQAYNKFFLDPNEFNREYTVAMVNGRSHAQPSCHYDLSNVGNVTLYPTPEGYMLGPHSVTVTHEPLPVYTNVTPSHSCVHGDPQFLASLTIPPDALSSNRPLHSSQENLNGVRLQGPIVFRQEPVRSPENVSPISIKLRSLKSPHVEKSGMTEAHSIRREIEKATNDIGYLRSRLQRREEEVPHDQQLHLLRDVLEQQITGRRSARMPS